MGELSEAIEAEKDMKKDACRRGNKTRHFSAGSRDAADNISGEYECD
jgi:hypothetical protein